ncbi:hypothetical protein FRC09_010974 [Ceratobasidium sp. 395]|nr:hypothetical protein FRC09_010974 [Ceratobasidium sp. 395]
MMPPSKPSSPRRHLNFLARNSQDLPLNEQQHWKDVAKEELANEQAASTIADPVARERYATSLFSTLQQIVAEAGQKANVRVSIQLLTEPNLGRFKLKSLVSSNLSDFAKSDSLATLLQALKTHVEESVEGSRVEGAVPLPDIIIDWDNGGGPLLPDVIGMPLLRVRKLLREYIKYKWAQAGGVGKVPWEEIGRAPHEWIDPERMPAGATWMDPGSMPNDNTFSWLEGIRQGQSGEVDPFQFRQVIAGPNPIDASSSQETGRKLVKRDGREVYVLEFADTITKCHAVGGIDGMKYSESSMAYTFFRRTGKMRLDKTDPPSGTPTTPTPPAEWMSLPFGADVPRSVIYGAEKDTLLSLTPILPQEHRERVENLVQLTNKLQSHLPASNDTGTWAAPVPPPKLMPSSPPTSPFRTFFETLWAEPYYKTPMSIEDTIFHIETWLNALTKSGVLIHGPSGTLLGGDTGVVWPVRVLIKIFFNFAAVKYNIQFPHPIPADCDISRLPLGEWPRLLGHMDSLAQLLRDSISILQRTSEARSLGLPSDNDNDIDTELRELVMSTMEDPSTSVKTRRHRKDKKGKGKAREDEGSDEGVFMSGESSDSSGEDSDWEGKDQSREHGESSSEEGGDEEKDGEEREGGDSGAFTLLDDSSAGGGDSTPSTSASAVASSAQETVDMQGFAPNQDAMQLRHGRSARCLVTPWNRRQNAFGPFTMPEHRNPARPRDPAHALELLDAVERNWAAASRDLSLLCDLHDDSLDLTPTDITKAKESAVPVFTKYLLLRRAAWKRVESLSQSFFEINARVLVSFRDAFYFYSYLNCWLEDEEQEGCYNRPEADRITARIENSSILLVEARWTYLDGVAFESLATEFLNRCRGDWLRAELPNDLPGLYRLAKSQVDWADEFLKLKSKQVQDRKVLWGNLGLSRVLPTKHLSSGMRFSFGNPTHFQEPSRLRDALVRAAKDLANPRLRVQPLVVDKDTNMEDMSSSDQAAQQTPVPKSSTLSAQSAFPTAPAAPPLEPTLQVVEPNVLIVEHDAPVAQSTPSIIEPTPPVVECTPSVAEPAPLVVEPAPLVAEPAPLVVEPALPVVESAPSVVEPIPSVVEPASLVVTSAAPVPSKPPAPAINAAAAPAVDSTKLPAVSTSVVKPTAQAPTGRKSSARISNPAVPSGSARRTSARHAAVPNNTPVPQANTRMTRAAKAAQVAAKEVAVGKRKSKARR